MIYRKYENVQGWQGWIDAVSSHPNVVKNFQKTHDFFAGNFPVRIERVEFIVAGKHVAYDRMFRGSTGQTHSDPLDPYQKSYLTMPGNVSYQTFDFDVMAEPDFNLPYLTEALQQCPYGMTWTSNVGIAVNMVDPDEGDEIGLIDDNYVMHAVHVFASADNLYIIFEIEEGVFLHTYSTADFTEYRSLGDSLLARGTYLFDSSSESSRSYRACGWQYSYDSNAPFLLNQSFDTALRNIANKEFGFQLTDRWVDSNDRKIRGGAPCATTYNGAIVEAPDEYAPPGSTQVHYGAYSIYGRSLSAPVRWWFVEGPGPSAVPLFELNQVRTIHMRGVRPLQEFVIDGVTWVAFPDVKLPNSYGGNQSTLFAAYEDEHFATPMGVLIRKD